MNREKTYAGIDYFRIIVAFLIVAIHTSPLLTYSGTGDFILTRVIARTAVPFFFMTSGFFLISRYTYENDRLKSFLKKTALLYGISIALYLPVNIYNGYFTVDSLLPNIIKDIFFDGTMYHLWYLPASMMGAAIAWFLVKRIGFRKAFLITALLYVVGMFGDSYYKIAAMAPVAEKIYGNIFEVSDYTRNGIFFAPVFFVLGGIIADEPVRTGFKKCLTGFAVSFGAMLAEALILHRFGIQRHDSMYVMLLPCMYFLFTALTFLQDRKSCAFKVFGREGVQCTFSLLRTASMILYIIHPMVIVAVRMGAKVLGMEAVFIENSVVHYAAVSVVSAIISMILAPFLERIKAARRRAKPEASERAWLEINLDHLRHNVETLNRAMPDECELMAVVKANAYGHGSFKIAACLDRMGVRAYAVATIEEGIALRRYGIRGEILILGYTSPTRARELHKYDLSQTVVSFSHADRLNRQGYAVKVHIKIDTGMHRLGFDSDNIAEVLKVFRGKNLSVNGIFTHLCVSDSLAPEDIAFTEKQISTFYRLTDMLAKKGVHLPKTHIQSSYGLLNYPELKCSYVRAGVSLYGVQSSSKDRTRTHPDLRPVLSLKTRVVLVREIAKGESVGYGRAFYAARDSRIAILSVGYADGLPRSLSGGNGEALINGFRAPVIGRICMDQLAVDITDIPDVSVGDIATMIGRDGKEELTASGVADNSGSISNELLSRMGSRLKIV